MLEFLAGCLLPFGLKRFCDDVTEKQMILVRACHESLQSDGTHEMQQEPCIALLEVMNGAFQGHL